MATKQKGEDTPKAPATGKDGGKAGAQPAETKADPKAVATKGKATRQADPKPTAAAKPKGKAKAEPTAKADPKAVAARAADLLGNLVDQPSLELLGVLHDEPMTGATIADRYETRPVNPVDPLRKHKLVAGDKARKFAPTPKGRQVWSWVVGQVGGRAPRGGA